MKKTSKFISLIMALLMFAGLLSGCGGATGAPVDAAPAGDAAAEAPVEELSAAMLNSEELAGIINGIDPQFAYDLIYACSKVGNDGNVLGFRSAGSTGEAHARELIVSAMEEIGLTNIECLDFGVDAWEFTHATLTTADGVSYDLTALGGSCGTDGEISGDIVYLGDGTAANYEGVDVTGKIVLIEMDNYAYWFSAPQYEAELAGAAAIICCTISDSYNTTEEGVISFDGCLRDAIPCLTISKKDTATVKQLLDAGQSSAKLDVKIDLNMDGTSQNVVGYIEGKDPTHIITMGAHYDGYYHSFQDDLYGVGMELAIAKAMIDAGYKPEYTIAFAAMGAEEYGVTNTVFDDWCIGAWSLVTENHPEWTGKDICHFEIDSIRPDSDTFCICATPELNTFFAQYLAQLDTASLPAQITQGTQLKNWAGPWSQDYNFTRNGIPSVTARQSVTEWKKTKYHTQFDDESAWNEEWFVFNANAFAQWVYVMDHCAIVPLDLSNITDYVKDGLDLSAIEGGELAANYVAALDNLGAVADSYYAGIQEINQLYAQLLSSGADVSALKEMFDAQQAKLLAAYKTIEDDYIGLDQWQTVAILDQYTAFNYSKLTEAKAALTAGDGSAALDALINVDTTYLVDFSKTVYEYVGITGIADSVNWAEGKTVPMLNTYDTYKAIAAKAGTEGADYTDEIAMMDALIAQELELLQSVIADGTEYLNAAAAQLDRSALDTIIAAEREALK